MIAQFLISLLAGFYQAATPRRVPRPLVGYALKRRGPKRRAN